jgi:hypothetical protein
MSNKKDGWHNGKKEPYARIWWRTANLNYPWALLEIPWTNPPKTGSDRNSLITTIKSHFSNPNNIYICFYKSFSLNDFYVPNINTENYNYEYNLLAPINIFISQSSSGAVNDVNSAPIHFKTKSVSSEETNNQKLTLSNIFLESSPIF